jgi:AcrR family transcriptional regulator
MSTLVRKNTMSDDTVTGLPASLEAAWGVRGRPNKGPKRGLSLEQIVEAAIKIALSEGLAAVSMNRIAADLGAAPMSLYRYVASKDELLALMIDVALGLPPLLDPDEGWREGLSRWAWAGLTAYRQQPWTLRIPITAPPITPNQIVWLEQGLRVQRDTGLAEPEKLSVIMLLGSLIRNEATLAANVGAAMLTPGSMEQVIVRNYGNILLQITDPEQFPAVRAAITGGAFNIDADPDTEFVFGLERILDGVEALIHARREAHVN